MKENPIRFLAGVCFNRPNTEIPKAIHHMTNRVMFCVRWLTLALVLLFANAPSSAQFVNAGLKSGFNISWTHPDDADFRNHYNTSPVPGYNTGAVFSFQLKKRYFLHTEILYSTKG